MGGPLNAEKLRAKAVQFFPNINLSIEEINQTPPVRYVILLYCTILYYTIPTVLFYTILYYTMLYQLYYTILKYTILYYDCTLLYCTMLSFTSLTVLCCISLSLPCHCFRLLIGHLTYFFILS